MGTYTLTCYQRRLPGVATLTLTFNQTFEAGSLEDARATKDAIIGDLDYTPDFAEMVGPDGKIQWKMGHA